jgi:hypothetical protein
VWMEIHSLMQRDDSLARRLQGLRGFPFVDRDETEFTRPGGLFQNEVLYEADLCSEQCVGCMNPFKKLLARMNRDAELIDSVYLRIHRPSRLGVSWIAKNGSDFPACHLQ